MKKKHSISIMIPEPCAQQYDSMKPVAGGRYCDSCAKTVKDFSFMTDAEIYLFLKNNPGNHCGKLHPSQLNRPIEIITTKKNFFQKISAVAATVMSMLLYKPAHAQLPKNIITAELHPVSSSPVLHEPDSILFKGRVSDEKNLPVNGAEVVLINGTDKYLVYTDSTGMFSIHLTGKLDPAATLSFTYYFFTKSELINPHYSGNPGNINVSVKSREQSTGSVEPFSGRLGGLVLVPVSVPNNNNTMVNTGAYSLIDTIRRLIR